MNITRLYKKSELKFLPYGQDPGRATLARVIGPDVSQTIGAGMATFDNTSVEWTVLYDEIIICLKGLFRLCVGDQIFEAQPGDVIWIPKNTLLVYEGEGAEVFYSIYPVDWATRANTLIAKPDTN